MSNLKILALLLGVGLLAGVAGYATRMSTGTNPSTTAVAQAPASPLQAQTKPLWYWEFADLQGNNRMLSEWQGPLLVVNFWATWCPPCLKEIPAFVALQSQFGAEKVQFLGIAYDYPEEVGKFLEQTPVNYPVLLGGDDVAIFMRELGNKVGGLPFTAVINADGQVLAQHQGEWHQADAALAIEKLLTK